MIVQPLIGFHGGGGGNMDGIGQYFIDVDAAGRLFCFKSVDDAGVIAEACRVAQGSGLPHEIVYRTADPGIAKQGESPDYHVDPEEAARRWVARWKESLDNAPELHPYQDLILLDTTNEPRTKIDPDSPNWNNMHPCDWLGEFACYTGAAFKSLGWRQIAFSMNGGTPEPEDWYRPGMAKYLKMCAADPHWFSIGLHEYNWGMIPDFWYLYNDFFGRFEHLLVACARQHIPYPLIRITEWGWAYSDMPGEAQAMEQVKWYDKEIVTEYHGIVKSVFAWTLSGNGGSTLYNKLQQLIKPLTDYTINTSHLINYPDRGKPREQYKRTYLLLPPNAYDDWARAASEWSFKKGGRRFTIGSSADDAAIGDLDFREIIAINPHMWGDLRDFYRKYYGLGIDPGIVYTEISALSPAEMVRKLTNLYG